MKTRTARPLVSVALLATGVIMTMAGSGCSTDGGGLDVKPTPTPVPSELEGTWTGRGTFVQELAGTTSRADLVVNLSFDKRGYSDTLPSLGVVSPWRLYVVSQPGVAADPWNGEGLQQGGTIWVYCPWEADGSANDVRVVSNGDIFDTTHREYLAVYKFADLFKYQLYDYSLPGAPQATVAGTDTYRLTGSGTAQRLVVTGRGSGTIGDAAQPIELRFDAELTRGSNDQASSQPCRLGSADRR